MRFHVILLTLVSTQSWAQYIASDPIDEAKLHPWIAINAIEYEAVYHFGDSEWESDLLLVITGDKIFAQIRLGRFSADGKMWLWNYENIKDVRITGNKFFSEKANGEFVHYDDGQEQISGLKINNPWSAGLEPGEYEIGKKSISPRQYLSGDYIQASLELLTKEELRKLDKTELKRMRNEIFARYGLLFKPGGEMDIYFRQKRWYQGQQRNVDNFLTDLEAANIRLIIEVENL